MKPIYVVFIDIFHQSLYFIFFISFNLCQPVKKIWKSAYYFFSKLKVKKFGRRIPNPTNKKKTLTQEMSLTSGVLGREMMKEKCGEQKPFKCISKGKIEIFELESLRTFLLNVQYTELFILRS